MAEQSWRIKKYIEYTMHPKRFEYEAKKEKLKGESVTSVINSIIVIANICAIAVCIIIAGVNFFREFEGSDVVDGFFVPLGIALAVEFIVTPLLFGLSNGIIKKFITMLHKKELSALKDEYYEKYDLWEVTESSIYKNKCGELDDWDNWVCSATGEQISYRKLCECHRDGCRNCKVLSDVLYNSIDMDVVRENERKFNEGKQLKKEKEKEARKQKEAVSNAAEAGLDADFVKLLQESPEEKKQKKKEKIRSAAFIAFAVISIIMVIILEKFGF